MSLRGHPARVFTTLVTVAAQCLLQGSGCQDGCFAVGVLIDHPVSKVIRSRTLPVLIVGVTVGHTGQTFLPQHSPDGVCLRSANFLRCNGRSHDVVDVQSRHYPSAHTESSTAKGP